MEHDTVLQQNRILSETIQAMLKENTGRAMMDSGGAYGRHWEHNQDVDDFEKTDPVTWDLSTYTNTGSFMYGETELIVTLSTFHYLVDGLWLDDACIEFNSLQDSNEEWVQDDDFSGLTARGQDYLDTLRKTKNISVGTSFNTCNYDSILSQVLQGTYITIYNSGNFSYGKENFDYVLLQIHGGCDVRGGYTTSKLFCVEDEYLPLERFSGVIDGVSVEGDGNFIWDEYGSESPTLKPDSKIDLYL